MAAVAFFYAGTLEIHWQLLIVVILLFFSTLAFFAVLFNESPSDSTEPLILPTFVDDDTANDDMITDQLSSQTSTNT